jgi:hypothetical protein
VIPSGTVCHRFVVRFRAATARRRPGAFVATTVVGVGSGLAEGPGVVVVGVQDPATSTRVNTRARYLTVT